MSASAWRRCRCDLLLATTWILALNLGLIWALAQEARTLTKGEILYQTGFEGSNTLSGWSGAASLEMGCDSLQSVALKTKTNASGGTISRQLPIDIIRGCRMRGSAIVRADQVSSKPNHWNGIKFMLVVESPAGKSYPQASLETGSFAWRRTGFTAQIPADATSVTLVLSRWPKVLSQVLC